MYSVSNHRTGSPVQLLLPMLFMCTTCNAVNIPTTPTSKHNILHIISDDLRPDLGVYLSDESRNTPNIDKLASSGTVFLRAYAQQAVCGPSRNSFLSGRRPDLSRSWNFINHFRQDHPYWTSLPGLFVKDNDYISLGAGKTYHPKLPPEYDGDKSWSKESLPYRNPCWNTADDPDAKFQDGGLPCFFCSIDIESHLFPKKFNTTVANEFCTTDAYEDTLSIWNGIQQLKKVPKDKFFYLVIGMHKPHLPWQASSADFAKHPLEKVQVAANRYPPKNVPSIALQYTEKEIHESPYDPILNSSAQLARRAYYATITGMDRKLKKLFDALEDTGRANNTAILFHSDHGWSLGENGEWRKFTNFEVATQVPFIISVPWIKNQVTTNQNFVELVDLFPTIMDLSGVQALSQNETISGTSLVPMLTNKTFQKKNNYALSQYPRRVLHKNESWKDNSIIHRNRSEFTHMGYTIRTSNWRYTEWAEWNQTDLIPIWSTNWNTTVNELYDHRNEQDYPINFDDTSETENVVTNFSKIAKHLSKILRMEFPSKVKST
jgi:iduronate 2-sulfatase